MSFKFVDGGVCAAKGFKASGIWCGIRANRTKRDLALIVSEAPCAAAAIYTQNKVKGAPILVTQEHLENGTAQAVLCNSGNANTCNADGEFIAHAMCESAANALKLSEDDFIIASTGVIGRPLPLEPITKAMPSLVSALRADGGTEAAEAIMTTDTLRKEVAVSFDLEGRVCTVGGIAKGSGMIHPNMATMLCFVTSDTAISPEMLRKACKVVADETFNMISVDGDTSTNDMMSVMANGLAGNAEITEKNEDYDKFREALHYIDETLAKKMAGDGEGATALFEAKVIHAATKEEARMLCKSVICSSLTKAMIYGHDANVGRIMCALGYAGVNFDPEQVDLYCEADGHRMQICKDGMLTDYDEEEATKLLSAPEVSVIVDMKRGDAQAAAWGCDLTHEYVNINADYRS